MLADDINSVHLSLNIPGTKPLSGDESVSVLLSSDWLSVSFPILATTDDNNWGL